jgi:hypothetical protein
VKRALALATLATACGGSSGGGGFGLDAGVDDARASRPVDDGHAATADVRKLSAGDSATTTTTSTGSGPAIVYGESPTTLYAVNPDTNAVTRVGDFSGCDSEVIDIALDKDSTMYATTFGGVYTVDTTTAACKLIAMGSYPNSLSFVPAGTLSSTSEALVGYLAATYVQIDTTTGAVSSVGSLGGNQGYASSGDIVSVIGGGTYLTITGGDDCSDSDCLVEVNPKTGALVTNYGPLGYSEVYGLAFWAGTVYGFDDEGDLFSVTFSGSTIHVASIPIPNAPPGLSWYGAGSTTSAPPVATTAK